MPARENLTSDDDTREFGEFVGDADPAAISSSWRNYLKMKEEMEALQSAAIRELEAQLETHRNAVQKLEQRIAELKGEPQLPVKKRGMKPGMVNVRPTLEAIRATLRSAPEKTVSIVKQHWYLPWVKQLVAENAGEFEIVPNGPRPYLRLR